MWGQWLGNLKAPCEADIKIDIDKRSPGCGTIDVLQRVPTVRGLRGNVQLDLISGVVRGTAQLSSSTPKRDQGEEAKPIEIDLELLSRSEMTISGTWKDRTRGTSGSFCANRADRCEPTPPDRVFRTWKAFKSWVDSEKELHQRRIFRGQSQNLWPLRATLFRGDRSDLTQFASSDVHELNLFITDAAKRTFDVANPSEHGALLHLAQHHGYPTPLLDWTQSAYIAAFFAFHKLRRDNSQGMVRIFVFESGKWTSRFSQITDMLALGPYFSVHRFLPIANPRAIPQQSVVTSTSLSQIEPWIAQKEVLCGERFLFKIDLPTRIRNEVMNDLAFMGISAATMFPGLDGACAALRERNFL